VPVVSALVSGVIFGGVYALIALGLTLQYGAARILNLAYGDVLVGGGLIAYVLFSRYGVSPLVVVALLGPLAFAAHLLIYRYVFVPLRWRAATWKDVEGSNILLAFGLSFVVGGMLLAQFGGQFYSYSYLLKPLSIAGTVVSANRVLAFSFALVAGVLLHLVLTCTRLGMAIRAVAVDPDGAPLVGLNVPHVAALAFAAGGAICVASGAIVSMLQPISVPMGVVFTLKALVVVIMGGAGNTLGAVAAGFLVGAVESVVAQWVSPGLTLVATYGLFVMVLLTLRTGLFGRALR